jgi:hypothetical protein
MKHIKPFTTNEDITQRDFEEKYTNTRGIGTKSDFKKFDRENKLSVYDEDYLMSRDCRIKSFKNQKGQIQVTIEYFQRGQDGHPQFIFASSDGIASTYEDAYLIAVEGLLD